MACQPAWASCLASPLPRVLPSTQGGICPRTLGRHRDGMTKERLGETDPDIVKGNRHSRTGEDRDKDAGCSIIHDSIKDAQA